MPKAICLRTHVDQTCILFRCWDTKIKGCEREPGAKVFEHFGMRKMCLPIRLFGEGHPESLEKKGG